MLSHTERGKLGGIKNANNAKLRKEQRVKEYLKEPSVCTLCDKPLLYEKKNNKFCSRSCSAKYNNPLRAEKTTWSCLYCDKTSTQYSWQDCKYCDRECNAKHQKQMTLEKYLQSDGTYFPIGVVKDHVMCLQDNKCSICNNENIWNEKKLVLVLDHIDGNSENNLLDNLRCVCPNCDSQLDTFKSKNNGNGRHYRRERYDDGKSF